MLRINPGHSLPQLRECKKDMHLPSTVEYHSCCPVVQMDSCCPLVLWCRWTHVVLLFCGSDGLMLSSCSVVQMDAFRRPSFSELLDELEDIAESLEPPDSNLTTGWGGGVTVYPPQPSSPGTEDSVDGSRQPPQSYTEEALYSSGPLYRNQV
jgi:hypothetical protein